MDDARDAAARIADSAIAKLREDGLDCVVKGGFYDCSHLIRQAIFRAALYEIRNREGGN